MYVEEDHPAKMLQWWRQSLVKIQEWQNTYNYKTTDFKLDEQAYILSHSPHEVYPFIEFITDAIITIHEEVKKK